MQIKCPQCGALIPAENINIQEMLAKCSECHHVFAFNRSAIARKSAPRKLKPPKRMFLQERDAGLELSYSRVFGPAQKFGGIMSLFFLVVYSVIFIGGSRGGAPPLFLLVVGLAILLFIYLEAVVLSTITRFYVDDDELTISRGPLPFPFREDKTLDVRDIVRIFQNRAIETGFFYPTHNLYAELRDGERVLLVPSLPREYARYIASILDDSLHGPGDDLAQEDTEASADGSETDLISQEETQMERHGSSTL